METNYVMEVDGAYRVTGSRVSLDSVDNDFLRGLSPESVVDNYDTLTLEQVSGAITYYLAHRAKVDPHLLGNRSKLMPYVYKRVQLTHCCIGSLKEVQEVPS